MTATRIGGDSNTILSRTHRAIAVQLYNYAGRFRLQPVHPIVYFGRHEPASIATISCRDVTCNGHVLARVDLDCRWRSDVEAALQSILPLGKMPWVDLLNGIARTDEHECRRILRRAP